MAGVEPLHRLRELCGTVVLWTCYSFLGFLLSSHLQMSLHQRQPLHILPVPIAQTMRIAQRSKKLTRSILINMKTEDSRHLQAAAAFREAEGEGNRSITVFLGQLDDSAYSWPRSWLG